MRPGWRELKNEAKKKRRNFFWEDSCVARVDIIISYLSNICHMSKQTSKKLSAKIISKIPKSPKV